MVGCRKEGFWNRGPLAPPLQKYQADLVDIRDYGVEQFGFTPAIAYIDSIERAFRQLLDFPDSDIKHKRDKGIVRSLSCHNHRIYYDIAEDAIVILRVLHKSMDAERWLW